MIYHFFDSDRQTHNQSLGANKRSLYVHLDVCSYRRFAFCHRSKCQTFVQPINRFECAAILVIKCNHAMQHFKNYFIRVNSLRTYVSNLLDMICRIRRVKEKSSENIARRRKCLHLTHLGILSFTKS